MLGDQRHKVYFGLYWSLTQILSKHLPIDSHAFSTLTKPKFSLVNPVMAS